MPPSNNDPHDVEPLTPDDRVAIAARLERDLVDIRAQLELLRASAAPVSMDLSIGRLSRVDAMQQQQMARASRGRAEAQLRQVGAAIRRLESGDYGECAICGGYIGGRRLLARPATPCCRPCEEDGP